MHFSLILQFTLLLAQLICCKAGTHNESESDDNNYYYYLVSFAWNSLSIQWQWWWHQLMRSQLLFQYLVRSDTLILQGCHAVWLSIAEGVTTYTEPKPTMSVIGKSLYWVVLIDVFFTFINFRIHSSLSTTADSDTEGKAYLLLWSLTS